MPRQARVKSETGIYHIMLQGINQQQIFEDEEDNLKFIQILKDYKTICRYKIYAYCLMGNHVHLLIKQERQGTVLCLSLLQKKTGGGSVSLKENPRNSKRR